MIFSRRFIDFIDRVTKPIADLFEKIEISVAGERWWIVGPKGTGKTVLHNLLSGEPVAEASYSVTQIHDETTSGMYKAGKKIIRHKPSRDYGGEFLETWEEGVKEHKRFVFVYSLNDLDGTMCYCFNKDAIKPSEKYELNRDDLLYENIMNAFVLAINIIHDHFSNDYSLPADKRKLLVLCNKTDLWPQGCRPQFFQPYKQIVEDMKAEVKALDLTANARFSVSYEACSFIMNPRTSFDAIMSKFLNKV
ncbi:MAG: hypothetical protein ICV66_03940 [Chitinophagaceae bacterium]|nr:hypothetical protein [Chitinophagaceae bacterium]